MARRVLLARLLLHGLVWPFGYQVKVEDDFCGRPLFIVERRPSRPRLQLVSIHPISAAVLLLTAVLFGAIIG